MQTPLHMERFNAGDRAQPERTENIYTLTHPAKVQVLQAIAAAVDGQAVVNAELYCPRLRATQGSLSIEGHCQWDTAEEVNLTLRGLTPQQAIAVVRLLGE